MRPLFTIEESQILTPGQLSNTKSLNKCLPIEESQILTPGQLSNTTKFKNVVAYTLIACPLSSKAVTFFRTNTVWVLSLDRVSIDGK